MLETLDLVDWASLIQPEWNRPDEVPDAIRALAVGVHGATEYNRLLYAVGNNHKGSYYPVVLWVIPFLGDILRSASSPIRETVLDILVDLLGSFGPEPGFEEVSTPSGSRRLADALRAEIENLTPTVNGLRLSGNATVREEELVGRLFDLLNEA